jgi:hypothetical protein
MGYGIRKSDDNIQAEIDIARAKALAMRVG